MSRIFLESSGSVLGILHLLEASTPMTEEWLPDL